MDARRVRGVALLETVSGQGLRHLFVHVGAQF